MTFQKEQGDPPTASDVSATKPISTKPPFTIPAVCLLHYPNKPSATNAIQDELSFRIVRIYTKKLKTCINLCIYIANDMGDTISGAMVIKLVGDILYSIANCKILYAFSRCILQFYYSYNACKKTRCN